MGDGYAERHLFNRTTRKTSTVSFDPLAMVDLTTKTDCVDESRKAETVALCCSCIIGRMVVCSLYVFEINRKSESVQKNF